MYSTKLFPDFNKLINYFTNINDEVIDQVVSNGGVEISLEYLDEDSYADISEGLKSICALYKIEDHFKELLYLIVRKNEDIKMKYVALWENYQADQTAKEIAHLLLAYKQSSPNQPFQLTVKSFTQTSSVKSTPIARWMAELIYNAIEKQEFPIGLFGHRIMKHLFGDNPFDAYEISLEKLKAAVAISPRKPTTKLKRLYVEFCLYMQVYLINQTHLTLPINVKLTDAHANLMFDLLELLGYLKKDDVAVPKDYIHSMFNNWTK